NFNIENSQQYDGDDYTPTNNNDNNNGSNDIDNRNNNDTLSTLIFESHRSINNSTPNTISSFSESSSVLSEMLNTNITTAPQFNNYIQQTTESNNHVRNEFSSAVDDMMNKLTKVLDYDPIDTDQSEQNVVHNPTSPYRNELNRNTHQQNQNRSVFFNLELFNNNNNNNDVTLPIESTSVDTFTLLENMSSQQTLELLSGVLQNKKHLLKRILDEHDDDINPKRSRSNENEEIASPFVDMNLSESLSSTSVQTQSNNTAVTDKLLIKGDWFGSKKVNGNIELLSGYLKAFPKNEAHDQIDFARLLAKYNVHYSDYEQSFKKNKTDTFPRTLTAADVKHKTWLFSNVFVDFIEKNSFLSERIVLDPSAIAQENNST
ncbi:unnamed protein product, partial [Adineta ricciae]